MNVLVKTRNIGLDYDVDSQWGMTDFNYLHKVLAEI